MVYFKKNFLFVKSDIRGGHEDTAEIAINSLIGKTVVLYSHHREYQPNYLREGALKVPDRADLGEAVVRDRLRLHIVPFEEMGVGGYSEIATVDERLNKIRIDYDAFLKKRAKMVGVVFGALASGWNWPSENG